MGLEFCGIIVGPTGPRRGLWLSSSAIALAELSFLQICGTCCKAHVGVVEFTPPVSSDSVATRHVACASSSSTNLENNPFLARTFSSLQTRRPAPAPSRSIDSSASATLRLSLTLCLFLKSKFPASKRAVQQQSAPQPTTYHPHGASHPASLYCRSEPVPPHDCASPRNTSARFCPRPNRITALHE